MQMSDEILIEGTFEGEKSSRPIVSARRLAWVGKGALAIIDQGLLSGSNSLLAVLLARWLTPQPVWGLRLRILDLSYPFRPSLATFPAILTLRAFALGAALPCPSALSP